MHGKQNPRAAWTPMLTALLVASMLALGWAALQLWLETPIVDLRL